MLVRAVATRIEGVQYFEKSMSPVTTPEDIYGPIDLIALADQGQWVRRQDGSLSVAHIAFLDEISRSNEAIRDTLLVAMNERLAQVVGFAPYQIPLLSLFSAANHAFDESAAAFNDRFLLREIIQPLQEEDNFVRLITGQIPDYRTPQACLTLDELRQAQAALCQVRGTTEVLQALVQLRQRLSAEGIQVSDRKWRQCGKLLKARAWLDGLAELDKDCLCALAHALWSDPKERKAVERAVYEVAAPTVLLAVEIEDNAAALVAQMPAPESPGWRDAAENCLQQLVDMHSRLQGQMQRSSSRNLARAQQALAQVATLHGHISKQLFADVSRLTLQV
jgi:MoxR-like ATPase